jgi:hypothetical protein
MEVTSTSCSYSKIHWTTGFLSRRNWHRGETKYGVQVPRNVREAFRLDEENKNMLWMDALSKEILALQKLNCFKVVNDNSRWHPARDGYQFAPLQIIFDVKQTRQTLEGTRCCRWSCCHLRRQHVCIDGQDIKRPIAAHHRRREQTEDFMW